MKYFKYYLILCLALALILPVLPGQAEEIFPRVLVIDKDPNGANVREAPSGKVVHVISYDDMRIVTVSDAKKGWFKVNADGVSGWMHGSILGLCADPTEEGDPVLFKAPNYQDPPLMQILAGSPVTLLDLKGRWLKVRYMDPKGRRYDGWLPEMETTLSEGGLEACAAAWAARR